MLAAPAVVVAFAVTLVPVAPVVAVPLVAPGLLAPGFSPGAPGAVVVDSHFVCEGWGGGVRRLFCILCSLFSSRTITGCRETFRGERWPLATTASC